MIEYKKLIKIKMKNLNIDLHNASFQHEPGTDNYIFVDPLTGDKLLPGVIPEGLLADDRMERGFTFLRERAEDIGGKVVLGRHGDAQDLDGYDVVADAKQHGNLLFIEGIGWQERDQEGMNKATHSDQKTVRVSNRLAQIISEDDYLRERWSQLFGSGIDVGFADIADSGNPLDEIMLSWDNTWSVLHDGSGSSDGHARGAAIAAIGYNNYREWYMCGILGEQLAERAVSTDDLGFVFLVGTTHQGVIDKLTSLGLSVETLQHRQELPEGNMRLLQAIGSLSVTGEQLDRIYR